MGQNGVLLHKKEAPKYLLRAFNKLMILIP